MSDDLRSLKLLLIFIYSAIIACILILFISLGIRFYNCSMVDEVIDLKYTIRDVEVKYPSQRNVEVIDSIINDMERRDYFNTISGDIIELRERNNRIKQLYKLK